MASEKVELLRVVYERWGRGDFKTEALYGDDFTITMGRDFPDTGVHAGQDGVAAYMKGFLEPWDRITIAAEEMDDSGEQVLVQVLQAGVGATSGIEVELRYFHLWSFSGGRPVAMETIMHEVEARARLDAH
jgi:ketosteroid isomerase-like protein